MSSHWAEGEDPATYDEQLDVPPYSEADEGED